MALGESARRSSCGSRVRCGAIEMAEKSPERWSQEVTGHSDALDLEIGVFTLKDPKEIAMSLKHSAEASERLKSDPYRSAMSMLNFYINRAGKNLSVGDRSRLQKAKQELRRLFHQKAAKRAH